jgi:hypothetical protein
LWLLLFSSRGRGCTGGPFFDNKVLRFEGGVAIKGLAVYGNLKTGATMGAALMPWIE